jgi:hypothetical protein
MFFKRSVIKEWLNRFSLKKSSVENNRGDSNRNLDSAADEGDKEGDPAGEDECEIASSGTFEDPFCKFFSSISLAWVFTTKRNKNTK